MSVDTLSDAKQDPSYKEVKVNQFEDIFLGQVYEQEVTVIAWLNAKGLGARHHPGHVALLVRKKREQDMRLVFRLQNSIHLGYKIVKNYSFRYFSFFPDEGDVNRKDKDAKPGRFSRSYMHDMWYELGARAQQGLQLGMFPEEMVGEGERFSPQRHQQYYLGNVGERGKRRPLFGKRAEMLVQLPMQTADSVLRLGLNTHRMCEAANKIKNTPDLAYIMISKTENCAGVAARLLEASGATAFSSLPTINYVCKPLLYMTPRNVVDYATAAATGIMIINNRWGELFRNAKEAGRARGRSGAFNKDVNSGLYSLSAWKDKSKVTGMRRDNRLRKVDAWISNYHKYSWYEDYPNKLKSLCHLIYYLYDYLKLRKSARRDEACHILIHQIEREIANSICLETRQNWPVAGHYGNIIAKG